MSVVKFNEKKQNQVKSLSNVISLIGKIGGIVLKVAIPFVILAMILIPFIINNIEVKENKISFKTDNIKVIDDKLEIFDVMIFDLDEDISSEEMLSILDNNSKCEIIVYLEAGFVFLLIDLIIMIIILSYVEKLFDNIKNCNTPFTLENVNYIKRISYLMIALIIISPLSGALFGLILCVSESSSESVNQKVFNFFPDYQLKRNQEQLKDVTIEDFLTMRVPYKYKYEPYTKAFTSSDWGEFVLTQVGGKEQIGEKFHYSTIGIQILSNIIHKASGMTLKEFATKYLFEPLEIKTVLDADVHDRESQDHFYNTRDIRGWVKDPSGNYTTGWGLSLTTDEWARIGLLVLNKGLYNDKRIVVC